MPITWTGADAGGEEGYSITWNRGLKRVHLTCITCSASTTSTCVMYVRVSSVSCFREDCCSSQFNSCIKFSSFANTKVGWLARFHIVTEHTGTLNKLFMHAWLIVQRTRWGCNDSVDVMSKYEFEITSILRLPLVSPLQIFPFLLSLLLIKGEGEGCYHYLGQG